MAIEVRFKYEIEQRVTTCFQQLGIIIGLLYDLGGNQYLVRTKQGDNWFLENQLDLTLCPIPADE